MKLQKYFWKRKSSSLSSTSDCSSVASSPCSSSSTNVKLLSCKSLPETTVLPPQSRLTTSKSLPPLLSKRTEVYDDSVPSSADESGLLSDKSSEYASEVQELVEVFRVFDSNGDGKISVSELGSVLTSLGDNPTEEELRLLVKEVDSDGDGSIDLTEFLGLHSVPSANEARLEELKAAFAVFDINKDGLITAQELYNVLVRMGEKELTMNACCQMIKAVDSDGDGFVSFVEFERMMKNNF
ncbi:hypothetical protein O6H91_17G008500 [Diphasiastrum complanatum]|uniref:Uncharacterized protein n=1 Tax=Diphasiastrum complanatum TaxID=34168 RepID=A0ACC2B3Z8_DIPCM|nr:hypothetical protein O6H91_17G008500 [Diphasiastrum complanatum]